MATYPAVPVPNSTDPPAYLDPVIEARFDSGAIATRSKYLRRRLTITLNYTTRIDQYYIIDAFINEVRGRAQTFDWTYPHGQSIEEVKDTTPIGITFQYPHAFSTGDLVSITNANPSINGIHTVTRTSEIDLTLDGTTNSGTQNDGGKMTWYFPKMRLVLANGLQPAATKLRGPLTDNHGIVSYSVTLEEDF